MISRFTPYQHSAHVYSVGELALYINSVLDADPSLSDVWLRGEVINVSRSPAGHHYFSLKDATGQLRCVLFRGSAFNSPVMPANGLALVAHGALRLYERHGTCELVADLLFPEGVSVGHIQAESLYARLEHEGLFSPTRKRPLPGLPRFVGVLSSEHGAVIHDLLSVLGRRYPLAEVIFLPTPVQGHGAAQAMVRGLHRLALWQRGGKSLDVIVLARGGGSDEDLAAFNDERLVRAIFASPVPVVSAVGHETNLTLSDLVADVRAPTPSAAAEIIAPDITSLRRDLAATRQRTSSAMTTNLGRARAVVNAMGQRLGRRMSSRLDLARAETRGLERQLHALSPRNTLARGYAIVRSEAGILHDAAAVAVGDRVSVELHSGRLTSTVDGIEPEA